MAALSRFLISGSQQFFKPSGLLVKIVPKNVTEIVRCGHTRTMTIRPSRWQFMKLKDYVHFYTLVGVIPLGIILLYVNVFIGPATLEPIPEGYVPKQWEYYRSPVTRFFSRYLCSNKQQEYEKYLHSMDQSFKIIQLRQLGKQVKDYIKIYQDYPAFGFRHLLGNQYIDIVRKSVEKAENED